MKLISFILLMFVFGCSNNDVVNVVVADEDKQISKQSVIPVKEEIVLDSVIEKKDDFKEDLSISNHDDVIKECVLKSLKEDKILRYSRLDVASFDGKVLIVGGVNAVEKIDVIHSDLKVCKDIKEINNQVVVDKNPTLSSLKKFDEVIFNEIITKISDNKEINLNNYRFLVYKSKVYIMGNASSSKELRGVLKIVRRVSGVSNIINYARVKK